MQNHKWKTCHFSVENAKFLFKNQNNCLCQLLLQLKSRTILFTCVSDEKGKNGG